MCSRTWTSLKRKGHKKFCRSELSSRLRWRRVYMPRVAAYKPVPPGASTAHVVSNTSPLCIHEFYRMMLVVIWRQDCRRPSGTLCCAADCWVPTATIVSIRPSHRMTFWGIVYINRKALRGIAVPVAILWCFGCTTIQPSLLVKHGSCHHHTASLLALCLLPNSYSTIFESKNILKCHTAIHQSSWHTTDRL